MFTSSLLPQPVTVSGCSHSTSSFRLLHTHFKIIFTENLISKVSYTHMYCHTYTQHTGSDYIKESIVLPHHCLHPPVLKVLVLLPQPMVLHFPKPPLQSSNFRNFLSHVDLTPSHFENFLPLCAICCNFCDLDSSLPFPDSHPLSFNSFRVSLKNGSCRM